MNTNQAEKQADNQRSTVADAEGARWMTFKELAALRGISKLSAVSLVRRHGWRRQRDNEGHVRALVPAGWAEPQADNRPHTEPEDEADNQADTRAYAATFEATLAAIEAAHAGEVAALRGERDAAKAMAAEAVTRAERAEQAAAGTRAKADALRDRIDVLEGELAEKGAETLQARQRAAEAEEAAEALRKAEAERKARGLVARLRAVWRGE